MLRRARYVHPGYKSLKPRRRPLGSLKALELDSRPDELTYSASRPQSETCTNAEFEKLILVPYLELLPRIFHNKLIGYILAS